MESRKTCFWAMLFIFLGFLIPRCVIAATITNEGLAETAEIGIASQSFTATASGTLTSISVVPQYDSPDTLKIYEGETTSGTPIHTQSINLVGTLFVDNSEDYSFHTITLDSTLTVTSGNVYTFQFADAASGLYSGGDTYSGGKYLDTFFVAGRDLKFQIVITEATSPPDVVSLSYSPSTISTENGGTSTLTVALSTTPSSTSVIAFDFGGNAVSGTDYTASSNSITIGTASTSGALTITSLNDSIYETDESLVATISSITNATTVTGASTALLSITDAQSAPQVSLTVGTTTSTAVAIDENGGSTTAVVTLSNATTTDVTVTLSYTGTATSGSDYGAPATTTVISSGSTTNAVTLTATDDSLYEAAEAIVIAITEVSGGGATENGDQSASVTIIDSETGAELSLSGTTTIAENAGMGTVTATLSNATTEAVTITYSFNSTGTGGQGTDWNTNATTNLISAGATTASFTLTAISDAIFEGADEQIVVGFASLSGGGATPGSTSTHTVSITEDDVAPAASLSVSPNTIAENAGTSTISVSLSGATSSDVTISLSYTGNAASGTDFTTADSITISGESTTGTALLTAIQDTAFEGDESLTIEITDVSGGQATENASQSQSITITDDDAAPSVSLSVSPTSISENSGAASITATMTTAATEAVQVSLSFGGTASTNNDYSVNNATSITISAGNTNNSLALTALDDSTAEGSESITIEVTDVSGGSASENGSQTADLTLTDDDSTTVSLTVGTTTSTALAIDENDGATSAMITLSNANTSDITVTLSYTGTATSGKDYSTSATTIVINAGSTTNAVTLSATDDSLYETAETIAIEITEVSGGGASEDGNQSASVTINDNETEATVSLSGDSVIAENAGTGTVTATLSNATTENVTITYSFSSTGTGGQGTDWNTNATTSLISAGQTTAHITVTAISDDIYEGPDEQITVGVASVSGGGATESGTQTQMISITEDDSAPTASLSVTSPITENAGASTISVGLSGATSSDVTIRLSFNGNATSGSDFITADSLTISPGTTNSSLTLTAIQDTTFEGDETVTVEIIDVSGGQATEDGSQSKTITITEDDSAPTVSLSGDGSMAEAGGAATLTASLNGATTSEVTVTLAYAFTGTGGSGTDFQVPATSLSISTGSTTNSITLTAISDAIYEGANEVITVSITGVSGGGASENNEQSHAVSITEDDTAPTVTLTASDLTLSESGTSTLTATLSGATSSDVTVTLSYDQSTATRGIDFTGATSLTISAGSTTGTTVVTVTDDTDPEEAETIVVEISAVTGGGATENGNQSESLSIDDNDLPIVSLSLADSTLAELSSEATTLTATLNKSYTSDVTVTLSASGTATSGNDYRVSPTTITISTGATTGISVITATKDLTYEGATDETFTLDIGNLTNGVTSTAQAQTITITEGDSPPTVTLTSSTNVVAEDSGTSILTVSLSVATTSDVVVDLSYTGTATSGTDYKGTTSSSPASSVTISVGSTTGTVTLTAIEDSIHESSTNETILVAISGVSGGGATESGEQQQTITITEGSAPPTAFLSVSSGALAEASGTATVIAQLSTATTSMVTIGLSFSGTAGSTDYSTSSSILTIDAGSTSGTVTVTGTDDSLYDPNETIIVEITSVSGGNASESSTPQSQTLTITDDEAAPTVSLTADKTEISENSGTAALTASLSTATTETVTVHFSYTNSLATQEIDFTGASSLIITAGGTTGTATLVGEADALYDPYETIVAEISAVSGGGVAENGNQSQTVILTESSSAPTVSLSIQDASMAETSGATTATVSLSVATTEEVVVAFSYSSTSTAILGTDLTTSARGETLSVTIGAGNTTGTLGLASLSDEIYDPNETAIFEISGVSGGGARENGDQSQSVRIDDDESAPMVTLSASSNTMSELSGSTTLTVSLSVATTMDVGIDLQYSGNATSGNDYLASTNRVTIQAGSTTGTVTLTGLSDALYEANETLIAEITSVSGGRATEKASQEQTLTLLEGSTAPTVSLTASSSLTETSGSAIITAHLSSATTVDVTVGLEYGGSATSGTDYTQSALITITAGSTTGSASLNSMSDTLYETNETIDVSITSVTGGSASKAGNSNTSILLTDDESAPTITLALSPSIIPEDGGQSMVTARLSVATTVDVVIGLNYGGSAESGSDYQTPSSSITISAGNTQGTTSLTSRSDALYEAAETIKVSIASVSGGGVSTQGTQSKTLTLTDAESPPQVNLSTNHSSISEASGSAQIIVTLDTATTVDVTIDLSYEGTATRDTDYQGAPNYLTIQAGGTNRSAMITAQTDSLYEKDETIIVGITAVSGGGATENGNQTTTLTLLDDESIPSVTLSASETTIAETEGEISLIATLSHASTSMVTVQLAYSGTGIKDSDYSANSSIVITAGATTGTIPLRVLSDALDEDEETIIIDIERITGGSESGTQQVTVSLVDEDDPPSVSMVGSPTTIEEANGVSTLTFSLSSVSAKPVTVALALSGTADSADYMMASSVLINAGSTTGVVTLKATPDTLSEDDETVIVAIANVSNGIESENQQQTITIQDDDEPFVHLSVDQTTLSETGGTAHVTATLSRSFTSPVTVNLGISGNADLNDFSLPSQLVIDAGATSQTVSLNTISDFFDENDETVVVTIDSLVNGVLGNPNQVTVTITDDDTAGITVGAISGNTHEDGATATFTVVLDTQPAAGVNLTVSSGDATEGTVSPTVLTFTPANWNVSQTVTVHGIDDLVVDEATSYTILIAAAISTDSHYAGMDPEDVTVINLDNDKAGFIVGGVQGALKEDAETPTTLFFTIRLKTPPIANVAFDLRITDTSEASFSETQLVETKTLTFTPENWQVDRTINLFSVDDNDGDGDQAFQVVFDNLSSGDSNYTEAGNPSLNLSNFTLDLTTIDDDHSGILVGAVEGKTSEDGKQRARVPVSLKTPPTTATLITVVSQDTEEVTVTPSVLTFTPENWAASQTVQLNGVDDSQVDGAQTVTLTFQADENYDSVGATASVINEDDDTAALVIGAVSGTTKEDGTSAYFTVRLSTQPETGETVTVMITSSNANEGQADRAQVIFTQENWNSDQTVRVFGVDDGIRDGKMAYQIILNTQSSTGIGDYQGLAQNVDLINEDDEVVGIVLSESSNPVDENGRTATFTVRLQLPPTADVTVQLASSNTEEGTVSPAQLTFTPENWKAEQTVTVTGIRGGVGGVDGDQNFIIQLTIDSTDNDYASLVPANVAVVNLDVDQAGLVQSTITGVPTEDGDTAAFGLRLLSEPQGNVVIDVNSSDTTEGQATPPSLTFTPNNWSAPQTIVVQGQNEVLGNDTVDGPQQFFVNLIINQGSTDDTAYDALSAVQVEFFNQDNDSAGFVVSEMSGATQENDIIPQFFTVKLSSSPANSSTVIVTLRTSDSGEGRLATNQLTFTAEDWSSERKVNVFGIDDDAADGDQSFYIHFDRAVSNDPHYEITPASVSVVNEDDDQARIVISSLNGTVREDGSSAQFKVRLGTIPSGNVWLTLTVADNSTGEVSLSKSTLTFNNKNWNADQTVRITGLTDGISDGDQPFTIHLTIDRTHTTDTTYNGLTIADVNGVNEDVNVAGLVYSETNDNTSEAGDRSHFTLRLRSQPIGIVVVNLSVSDPEEAQLQTHSVRFDDTTWSAPQTIAVLGLDDDQQDDDQRFYVELTVADSTTDSLYQNLSVARVPFINEDNDVSNFIVTPIKQNTREDGTAAEFKVRLSSRPAGNVGISFQVEGSASSTPRLNDEVHLSTESLTFTPENWKADQRVILRGVDDDDSDGDQSFVITFEPSQSPEDSHYHGQQLDLLQGINEDDDIAEFVVEPLASVLSEEGTQTFFRLRLRSRPAEGTTVAVSFQVAGNDTALPTLSASSLEFTPTNWKAWQTVVMTGQDDLLIDGDQLFKIVFAPVVSLDPRYQGLVIPTLEGFTLDNDAGGILVSAMSGPANEQRQRAYFTLKLKSPPTAPVTVSMSIEQELDSQGNEVVGEGELIPGDETVIFTTDNWNAEQIVRVSGLNDDFQDGDQRFQILFDSVVSEDTNYQGLTLEPISVINEDDDISGFVISEISRPVREDGTTAIFEISLRSRPQDENQGGKTVQVSLSSSDTTEGIVEPSTLTFTSENWRAVHRVRVMGVDDSEGAAILDGDQTFRIDFGAVVSEDPNYHGQIPDSVEVTNLDKDIPEFIVSSVRGQTSEDGAQATFTVRLRTQPENDTVVTLPIISSNTGEATVSPSQLTFTADNFSGPQTVTITGVDDGEGEAIQDGDQAYILQLGPALANGSIYNGVDPEDIRLSNLDNESAGFVISEISGSVSEEGLEETISVRLRTKPTGTVTVPVRSSQPTEGKATVAQLTFNDTNWSADQVIGVVGQDETSAEAQVADGNQPFRILFAPEVDPENAACTTDPNLAECRLTVMSDDLHYQGLVAGEVAVVNLDNDFEGIVVGNLSGSVSEDGRQQSFFVRLRSNPQETVILTVNTPHTDEVTVSPNTLTYNADNWRGQQIVTVSGVDDTLLDGDQLATINIEVATSSSAYLGVLGEEIEVLNEDNDRAGIWVDVVESKTGEDGSVATFTVRLQSQPASGNDVKIHLTSSDTTEGSLPAPTLIFTASNWDAPQTVRVLGEDDGDADGDVNYQIALAVDAASDAAYLGMLTSSVSLTNVDDEKPGFITTQPTNATREDGTQAFFFIRLSSAPQTGSSVSINLQSSNTNEGQVFPTTLFFDEHNWNANQTVTIIGQDDVPESSQTSNFWSRLLDRFFRADSPQTGVKDGDQFYQLIFDAVESTDPQYHGMTPNRVRMVNEDDDTAGIILSSVDGFVTENGGQGHFQVELRTRPTDSVILTLVSDDESEGLVSPSQIVFTPENWNAAQTVTVTGVNDDLLDGNRTFGITLNVADAGNDAEYIALTDKTLSVTNEDNDSAGLVIGELSGQASENGEVSTFTVSLQSQPIAAVQVNVSSLNTDELIASPNALHFDTMDWNVPQTVTLRGQDEAIKDGHQTVRIVFTTDASADGNYAALNVPFLETTNEDNDIEGFVGGDLTVNQLSEADLTTTASFDLKLKTQPISPVTVNFSVNKGKDDEIVPSPTSLEFTTDSWNIAQTVHLNPQNDSLADGDQMVRIVGTSTSGDANYDQQIAVNQTLVNLDDDTPGVKTEPSTISVVEGATATFVVQLSTEPTHDVVLTFFSSDTNLGTLDTTLMDTGTKTNTLTFSPSDWNIDQSVLVTAETIDGEDSIFQVGITVSSDDNHYNELNVENVVVSIQNQASLVVSSNAITVGENASTGTFSIKLGALPKTDVTLDLVTDTTEAFLSPSSVTFTPENWDRWQEVVVTGVDDLIVDDTTASTVQITIASEDASYKHLEELPLVTIHTEDNDLGDFLIVGETDIVLTEADTHSETLTAQLTSEPLADVVIDFSSSFPDEVQVTEQLVFTSSNWNLAQTVLFTTVDDVLDDGDQNVLIQAMITSGDAAYATRPFPSISVMTVDDDEQINAVEGSSSSHTDTFSSSQIQLSIRWDPGVTVGSQEINEGDIIREYLPAEGSISSISKTTTIMHKAPVNGRQPGLAGVVEPQLVEGQKSTVYLEGSASGFVSDAASFVGTKITEEASVQASINFDGGVEIAVTSSESSQTVLLPEMALGANAVISETGVEVEMALPDNSEGAPRLVGAIDSARWYYMGRDLETKEVVYLRGLKGGKIKIIRQLSGNTTLIRVEAGSVEMQIGQASPVEKRTGEEIQVINQAYEFPIQAGSNLISAGVGSLLSPAELEVKMRHVHSVWRWNYVAPDWQVYSPQTTVNQKLTEALQVSPMTTDIQLDEGLWIYAEAASTFWMHDKDYVELKPDLSLGGWYLLGNNTGKPIPIGEFFGQNSEIQSLWLVHEDRWKAYATDSQIDALIVEELDVDQLSSEDVISPGQAFWVNTETGITITRENLRLPPGGIKSE